MWLESLIVLHHPPAPIAVLEITAARLCFQHFPARKLQEFRGRGVALGACPEERHDVEGLHRLGCASVFTGRVSSAFRLAEGLPELRRANFRVNTDLQWFGGREPLQTMQIFRRRTRRKS